MVKDKVKKRNNPIAECFSSKLLEKTEDHWLLEEVDSEPIAGKYRVMVSPKDVHLESTRFWQINPAGRDELKKRYPLLLEKGTRIVIPGKHRTRVLYLPDRIEDIPDNMKDTVLGEIFAIYIEALNEGYKIAEVLYQHRSNRDQVMQMMASPDINEAFMKKIEDRVQSVAKNLMSQAAQKLPDKSSEKKE